jgi:transcription antitermination factor NusG
MFRWYVVNTYSGHENKVKHNLEHRVVSLGQQRAVRSVVVPTEAVAEMKDNQKITVEKRTMPGYVLVNMELNEDSWGVVKGTPGVTGFVGASQEPVPLTQGEVDRLVHDRRVRQGRLRPAVRLLRRDLRDQRGRRPPQGAGINLRPRDARGSPVRPGKKALSGPMTGAGRRPRSLVCRAHFAHCVLVPLGPRTAQERRSQ